jgi:hypothetical protein
MDLKNLQRLLAKEVNLRENQVAKKVEQEKLLRK